MRGTRRPDGTLPHELEAGEYALASPDARTVWLCSPEGQAGHVTVPTWAVEVHEDETVTIDPSIWWDRPTGWHGFLRRGVWERA
jgi:hypothetical protein